MREEMEGRGEREVGLNTGVATFQMQIKGSSLHLLLPFGTFRSGLNTGVATFQVQIKESSLYLLLPFGTFQSGLNTGVTTFRVQIKGSSLFPDFLFLLPSPASLLPSISTPPPFPLPIASTS